MKGFRESKNTKTVFKESTKKKTASTEGFNYVFSVVVTVFATKWEQHLNIEVHHFCNQTKFVFYLSILILQLPILDFDI